MRHSYSALPANRLAERSGSMAEAKAIIENRGTRWKPIF